MLGLGLAFSHAPAIFCPAELWPVAYATIPEAMRESQPRAARLETMDVIRGYIGRIERAYATLGAQIRSYRPDALIFIGDDQGDMFDARSTPALCLFTGASVWGTSAPRYMKVPPEAARVEIPVHAALARHLRDALRQRGFDVAGLDAMPTASPHPELGVSHMLALPYPRLVPALDIPVIPLFVNTYFPPQPSAQRCWELGVAIADILRDRPERMAILDRLILRIAICEMLRNTDTPGPVIINEALELARTFSTEESVKFINGLLDAIRKKIEGR